MQGDDRSSIVHSLIAEHLKSPSLKHLRDPSDWPITTIRRRFDRKIWPTRRRGSGSQPDSLRQRTEGVSERNPPHNGERYRRRPSFDPTTSVSE